jgi:hypothetical protein
LFLKEDVARMAAWGHNCLDAIMRRARSLPDWFLANRVKGNTRLGFRRWHDEREFAEAAKGFKALGAGAFTRHVKSRDEDPWPSAVWQQIIDEAHGEGLRIVTYYWHMSEATLAAEHEEWICKEPECATPSPDDRGTPLDITGPYREVVLDRLRMLAAMGADGFMFDERHLPPTGCWCSALADAWTTETGLPVPADPDEADPVYRQFLDFKARKIEDTFAYWRDRVHADYPQVVFVVSTTTIPALTDREMTTRLARIADSAKNEYRLAISPALNKHVFECNPDLAEPSDQVREALGWTLLRDSGDGRPPYVWVSGVPNDKHARAAAGSLLTFGCIANMDVDEQSLLGEAAPAPGKTPLDALRAAFELGRRASPHLAGARPVRWAALHFAERARNARGNCYRAAWEQVLWPLVGAFQALCEDGLPVGIVNDSQLERGELADYRLLVLPDPNGLTTAQQRAAAEFAAGGGIVIENDPAWAWSDPAGQDAAFAAFRAEIRPHARSAPIRVTGGPAGSYAVAYRSADRLVVAVTNDFDWVQITNRRNVPSHTNPPAPPAEGVTVTWGRGFGLPELPRLRAVEVIHRQTLDVVAVADRHRVTLPRFSFMALLVVTRT